MRCETSLTRDVRGNDGRHLWYYISDGYGKVYATIEEAMTRIELELAIAGDTRWGKLSRSS